MVEDLDVQELHKKLKLELARLQGHAESVETGTGQRAGTNLDRDDLARNFASQERQLALRDVERTKIVQIEKTLERIANGTYGICTECGETIDARRLKIIPYASLCIGCQREQIQD